MEEELKKEKIEKKNGLFKWIGLASTFIMYGLLAFVILTIWFFPQGAEYMQYQKNIPVIEAYENCIKQNANGCTVFPVALLPQAYRTPSFMNNNTVNWSNLPKGNLP